MSSTRRCFEEIQVNSDIIVHEIPIVRRTIPVVQSESPRGAERQYNISGTASKRENSPDIKMGTPPTDRVSYCPDSKENADSGHRERKICLNDGTQNARKHFRGGNRST